MLPTLVLIGRPNVGKSTLFNRLTRSRDALVADQPGLTRDRHYGRGRVGERPFLVVDTGGLEPIAKEGILYEMAKQTRQAVDEADLVLFLVDGRQGLTPQDRIIAEQLRKTGRPLLLLVNKAEGMQRAAVVNEFFELGIGEPLPISSAHGDNVSEMVALALEELPLQVESEEDRSDHPKIAIVGRPNVGKSTLVNAILGEERVIAFDQPGTTRDSIYIDFERGGKQYTIIDTAGVRRRGKVDEAVEKFSVIKTLQAVEDANVVVLVVDAQQTITEQDAHIADFVLQAGRALVLAVNKWDGLDDYQRDTTKRDIDRKLHFLSFAKLHFISALHGNGVPDILKSVNEAYAAAMAKLPTPQLTRVLIAAVEKQQPPRSLFRPKMRYAHQGGSNPPLIVIHGSALDKIPDSYRRYLEHTFCAAFKLQGTPLRIEFKAGKNPFANKTPQPLTESEERSAHRARIRGRRLYGR
ncbi:MAG: ribosome biogenesis GTPase Der [Candidatus Nitrotoga sp.]|nr:ribosome biogenesis GTPase Der [Candidatus Nitrotoga sp.]RFC41274.1 MAG: GTP-binding protein [Candidatus Nitrotoga sp. CP45]MDO9446512.1 ribosome biogenesis GTPase Der [Candidatus Nitrotoga sp.]MDP1638372.1 ribosome biogenesis GTPase Der [Candidatus Nitrotoga sp.]MDP1855353.1 ribosome biogenesis GTPase Der [Candidatus Nitrotoga sp.]